MIINNVNRKIRQVVRYFRGYSPPGTVDFGDLYRLTPLSCEFGFDRGQPIDRYYIEKFLANQASHIQGKILEVGDATYTNKFGGDAVSQSEVLHVNGDNPNATIVADLTDAPQINSNQFDCFILTQTLNCIYDLQAAITTCHRILKPGGILLATLPGITQLPHDQWQSYQSWSLTPTSAQKIFETCFPTEYLQITAHGNVLASISFLMGISSQELTQKDLDFHDPQFPLLITVKAVKFQ
ncbi:methyltransferase domain-containing protein [Synechococcales cyanobacterium C]|uniref:Methyltransferase domain-containing protein n=1 Tax=Petrachloros mirabilis ULC683 TaxID=2781853 RepID=A0A8K2A9R2_9CYAN|nr:methyltransferase domain-containing protein [Petrachloros mirabilis]NCJ08455.1 methyltransferase domain-containing protein [Petrachloros mirabilis ULC683]